MFNYLDHPFHTDHKETVCAIIKVLDMTQLGQNLRLPTHNISILLLDYFCIMYRLPFSNCSSIFISDPSIERIQGNLAIFEENARNSRANEKLMKRYNRKAKERKVKKKRKFPKFYYTPDEDHYQRYLLEKTVAKRLCRGETKPIVSFWMDIFEIVLFTRNDVVRIHFLRWGGANKVMIIMPYYFARNPIPSVFSNNMWVLYLAME